MIHQFINNGYFIVLDVETSSIHCVDEASYIIIKSIDLLSNNIDCSLLDDYSFKQKVKEKSINELEFLKKNILFKNTNLNDFDEIYDEIKTLVKDNLLFTKADNISSDLINNNYTLKALCLHIAHDCNLACKYCFASEGNYKGKKELMTFDVGKKAIDFLINESKNRVNLEIDFFGGEPLLNFDVIKKLVEYGRSIEKKHNKNFRFTLTTNGILLNDNVIDFCNKEMSNVVLSLDGRKEINDFARPTVNGKGSYDLILPNFKRFLEKRGNKDYYVRGTFTHYNLDFDNDVMHYVDLGFKNVSMEPVVATKDKDYAIKEDDIDTICDSYDRLAKKIINANISNKPFNFFHFMINLKGGPCIYKRIKGCGSGVEYMSVTPNGDLYPCHQFASDNDFKMGNIYEGITNKDLSKKFCRVNLYSKDECRNCFSKYFCSGGCMANSYNENGTINSTYKIGCILQRKRVECAIMIKIANKEVL